MTHDELKTHPQSLAPGAAEVSFQGAPLEAAGPLGRAKLLVWEIVLFVTNHVVNHIPSHALRLWFYRRAWGWQIGRDTSIHMGLELLGRRGLVRIGDNTVVGRHMYIAGAGLAELRIGSNVLIAPHVHIALGHHDPVTMRNICTETVVGDNAIIYLRATILPGVHIGEGGIVGAAAVVSGDVPPYTIVSGNPARTIGERPREIKYKARWFWRWH